MNFAKLWKPLKRSEFEFISFFVINSLDALDS